MRRKLFLMSQVLGETQDQQQMPPATAQIPAGHGEGSDFWLTGWPTACESPLSRACRTTPGKHRQNIVWKERSRQWDSCLMDLMHQPSL